MFSIRPRKRNNPNNRYTTLNTFRISTNTNELAINGFNKKNSEHANIRQQSITSRFNSKRMLTQSENKITLMSRKYLRKIKKIQEFQKFTDFDEQIQNTLTKRNATSNTNRIDQSKIINNHLQNKSKRETKLSICCKENSQIFMNPTFKSFISNYSDNTFRFVREDYIDQERNQSIFSVLPMKDNFSLHQNTAKVKIIEQIFRQNNTKVYSAMLVNCTHPFSNQQVALKKIKVDSNHLSREEFMCNHLNNQYIVKVFGTYQTYQEEQIDLAEPDLSQPKKSEQLNIIMEKYDKNLFQILETSILPPETIKLYLYQMLRSLAYLHSMHVCHRDIKPSNFLVKKWKIVLADFGMAKYMKKNSKILSDKENEQKQKHTTYIFAREYRAPELLLGYEEYSSAVDIWALGCLAAEMFLRRPLFNGLNNLDQLVKIMKIIGSPKWQTLSFRKKRIPNLPKLVGVGLQEALRRSKDNQWILLIGRMLQFDPKNRITALQALCSPYFDELRQQSTYRRISQDYNCPNFFDFSKKQLYNNEEYWNRLVPFWVKQHCRKYKIKISEIKKL